MMTGYIKKPGEPEPTWPFWRPKASGRRSDYFEYVRALCELVVDCCADS
jgi:hypothetical protein